MFASLVRFFLGYFLMILKQNPLTKIKRASWAMLMGAVVERHVMWPGDVCEGG